MNVNSRGHKLDTRFEQLFPEIKHPPGIKTRWVFYPLFEQPEGIIRIQFKRFTPGACMPNVVVNRRAKGGEAD